MPRGLGRECAIAGVSTILVWAAMGCGSDDAATTSTPATGGSGGGVDAGDDASAGSEAGTGGSGGFSDASQDTTGDAAGAGGSTDAASDTPVDSPAPICTPGLSRCEANLLERCSADGTAWVGVRPCATVVLCDAAAGSCIPPTCLPNEHRCSGEVLEVCDVNQTGWVTKQTCADPSRCNADFETCTSSPCFPGVLQCSGNILQECNATSTAWTDLETCASSALCDAAAGTCQPPTCASDEFRCDGANLQVCNFGQTGWLDVTTCASTALCDGAGGECDACVSTDAACDGATLLRCSSDGQQMEVAEVCASPERCDSANGRCERGCETQAPGADQSCGVSGNQDCCSAVLVPGGTFSRSYDAVNYMDATYVATLDDFRLDTFEVTTGRFREFVDGGLGTQASPPVAGDGAHPRIPSSGWNPSWNSELVSDTGALKAALNCDVTFQSWSDTPGAKEHRPINCVTWYEAFAFCSWLDARLPTEAEWNYAASGGDEHRVYPWGSSIDSQHAVYACEGDGTAGCAAADITSVGSRSTAGDGRWGHTDLAGSISEWVLDRFLDPYPLPCNNCAAVTSGSGRMRRGGSWNDTNANLLRNGYRGSGNPGHRFTYMGFRCARSMGTP